MCVGLRQISCQLVQGGAAHFAAFRDGLGQLRRDDLANAKVPCCTSAIGYGDLSLPGARSRARLTVSLQYSEPSLP